MLTGIRSGYWRPATRRANAGRLRGGARPGNKQCRIRRRIQPTHSQRALLIAWRRGPALRQVMTPMKIHFVYRIDRWTADGNSTVEHVACADDLTVAAAASTLLRGAGRASPSRFERAPASLRTVARTASCDAGKAGAPSVGTGAPYPTHRRVQRDVRPLSRPIRAPPRFARRPLLQFQHS